MQATSEIALLPDVQARADRRNLAIEAVGVRRVRNPVTIRSGTRVLSTIATFSMGVGLAATTKGTHMSRFIELLEARTSPLDQRAFRSLVQDMLTHLEARSGEIEMQFPWFVTKAAPVSRVQSQLDYDVCWRGRMSDESPCSFRMQVSVPTTSLCPCSKEISKYGAHNQRSIIRIDAELSDEMAIEELIAAAEASASCELYGLLKRADEKYVTERAFENPKFAEDLVRDVALELNRKPAVLGYVIEAENFESIHNHSAFARLARPSPAAGERSSHSSDAIALRRPGT